MQTIKLNLSLNEINLILQSLAKQPFELVAQTINLIKSQAEQQLAPSETKTEE